MKDNYIEILKESISKRKPSPTFAYELVYGKEVPGGWRSGRYPKEHKSKMWNNIEVDYHLKDEWLDELNKIKKIEIRGTCEGHSKDWITYISFRLDPKYDNNEDYLNSIVKKITKYKNVYCGWDIGVEGRPRFVCATNSWYGKPGWEEWWNMIVKILKNIF